MKKTIWMIFLAVIMICSLSISVAAADLPLLYDDADLLTETEEKALLSQLESLSRSVGLDVVVVTVNSTGSLSPTAYADDFYDDHGYGQGGTKDGLLLLVSMENNDWWISTRGYAITAFTDAGIEYIGKQVTPYLHDGDYLDAFKEFAAQCEDFVAQARSGDPYDAHNLPKAPFNILRAAIIALIIGFVIAKIHTGRLKKQMKSVQKQAAAADYVRQGSLNISTSHDIFLYRTVNKSARNTSNSRGGSSTHRSSSGASHGGGGGKF